MDEEFLAKRHSEAERDGGGLLIVGAQYGSFPEEIIDVTVQVQCLVDNSRIVLQTDCSYAWQTGFYDPAPFKQKHLQLRYLFLGEEHEVTFEDGEMVLCPLQPHSVTYQREVKRVEREQALARRVLLTGLVMAGVYVAWWRKAEKGGASLWERILRGIKDHTVVKGGSDKLLSLRGVLPWAWALPAA